MNEARYIPNYAQTAPPVYQDGLDTEEDIKTAENRLKVVEYRFFAIGNNPFREIEERWWL